MDKISVMICDDSALMRNLIGRIITEIDGFEIAGKAENGQVCLSMIEEKKPDVILLDVEMPVVALARQAVPEHHAGGHGVRTLDVGVVEALDVTRGNAHAEVFLELRHDLFRLFDGDETVL